GVAATRPGTDASGNIRGAQPAGCWPHPYSMMRRRANFVLRLVFPLLFLPSLHPLFVSAPETATLTYRRVFKSSSPEFIEIKLNENGGASYDIRQLDEPPYPQPLGIGAPLRSKTFELAAQLNYFRDLQLDIRRRIANLGEKTFRYERGGQANEVSFNYTLNATANQLKVFSPRLAMRRRKIGRAHV